MADESQYSSGADATATITNKRKYDDQTPPRRATGFSSPDAPQSYNNVPPPVDEIQAAKQKAQEIAARLLSGAAADIKRSRVDNGASGFDSMDKGFSSAPSDLKSLSNSAPSAIPVSYGSFLGGSSSSKKIDIPNGRVGVIIGKGGETIKYLQTQSGAKIQVTRDMDSDPNSVNRAVELMGTPEQITKAEQLITEVLSEADAGGSGTVSRRFTGQGSADTFVMKIANNKVGLVIGKGGDTIKNMQNRSGARIQVIPLHLPPGDTSTERNVHIEGTSEQIEFAKQLVIEVTSENRARNPSMGGAYPQQAYQARPQTTWSQPGAPQAQQAGYGYTQPGAYPGPSPQYNMSQPSYPGYPPQPSSGGYPSNWEQSNASATQQAGQGYDYYNQQASSQPQTTPAGSAAQADSSGYNYGQQAASGYNHQGQGYAHDGYGGYTQSGYGQPPAAYDQQQQGYTAPNYGSATQEGHTPPYGAQGDSTQAPSQPQPGYATGQQPQGTSQQGYGAPPTSQAGYGTQPPAQSGYGSGYGAPPSQKPPGNYGQPQQSPTSAGGYGQQGYAASGYAQPESGTQRTSSGFNATGAQSGYGAAYGQSGYGQGAPPYNTSYGTGYSQPPAAAAAYSGDGNGTSQSGVAKTSPQS
ncbi:KH domain-containing protein [Euphorbia peplus]|nr:KH domain-containing protein [Euphorbia peplus]